MRKSFQSLLCRVYLTIICLSFVLIMMQVEEVYADQDPEHGFQYWQEQLVKKGAKRRLILFEMLKEAVTERDGFAQRFVQLHGPQLFYGAFQSEDQRHLFQKLVISNFTLTDLPQLRHIFSPLDDGRIADAFSVAFYLYAPDKGYMHDFRSVLKKAVAWDWQAGWQGEELSPKKTLQLLIRTIDDHLGPKVGYHVRLRIRSRHHFAETEVMGLVLEWCLIQARQRYDRKSDEMVSEEKEIEKSRTQVVNVSLSESEEIAGSVYGTRELVAFKDQTQARSSFRALKLKKEGNVTQVPEGIRGSNWGLIENPYLVMPKRGEFSELKVTFQSIEAGTFLMGSREGNNNDHPQHKVTISQGFEMQETEVTNQMWYQLMGSHPHSETNKNFLKEVRTKPNHPVTYISWEDTQAFIRKLNALKDGFTYRLPYEAEWEYAARANTKTSHYWKEGDINNHAWYSKNSGAHIHEVGKLAANEWGLKDMSGNVWEWCQDWWNKDHYQNSPATDPKGPSMGKSHVIRGGSWHNVAQYLRSAARHPYSSDRNYSIGFRLLRANNP